MPPNTLRDVFTKVKPQCTGRVGMISMFILTNYDPGPQNQSYIYMTNHNYLFLMTKIIRIISKDRVPLRKFAYVKYKHFKTSFLISNVHCTSFRQLQKHLNIYFLMLRLQISKISFSAKYCLILTNHTSIQSLFVQLFNCFIQQMML